MRKIIDNGRLVKRLFWVGASGFFARSYAFFSGNVIKLELLHAYPSCGRLSDNPALVLDQIGHISALFSMLIVGNLADLWGRKKLYGFELLLLIIATLGIVQASEGFRSRRDDGTVSGTMDIYSWLAFWRFCLGLAIGAEQPLVAIITAEWVRTKSRGRMLAAIFALHPIARLLAYGIALAALRGISRANGLSPETIGVGNDGDGELSKSVADQVWRWVTGVAILPALVAIGFRFTIPETPLYYADILLDAVSGARKTAQVYITSRAGASSTTGDARELSRTSLPDDLADHDIGAEDGSSNGTFRLRDWYAGAWRCLRTTEAGRNLALISALWVLTDAAWYCLSLESLASPSTLWFSQSAASCSPTSIETGSELNRREDANLGLSLYNELEQSAKRFMLVVSIGSLLGSAILLLVINRFHRRVLLMATCGALAVLFAITGAVILGSRQALDGDDGDGVVIDVLSGMMHFLFTMGPRTLILVMATELFPTVYRGTFYGIASAAGRAAAIAIRPVIARTTGLEHAYGIRLLLVTVLMIASVVISYHLPLVQRVPEGTSSDDEGEPGSSDGEGSGMETGPGTNGSSGEGLAEKGRAARRKARSWVAFLFPKLETMTLEDIAPNPHERHYR